METIWKQTGNCERSCCLEEGIHTYVDVTGEKNLLNGPAQRGIRHE